MTKVSVFGQETEKKKGKPIEFSYQLLPTNVLSPSLTSPKNWDNVELFVKGREENENDYDIILSWDNKSVHSKAVFLGHWNDGFVE